MDNTASPARDQAAPSAGAALLDKINAAVRAANAAEETMTTAQAELVSRSKAVGLLLLEAKTLHPKVKDFEAFLKKVQGLKLSRAYDLLRLAGGRTTDAELKKDARERKQRSRAAKKKPTPPTLAEPMPVSVTDPPVTETAEASAERPKAENADSPEEKAAKASADYLAAFTAACRMYLPKITIEADRQKARLLVSELTSSKANFKVAA
jgi:hypothetical protein